MPVLRQAMFYSKFASYKDEEGSAKHTHPHNIPNNPTSRDLERPIKMTNGQVSPSQLPSTRVVLSSDQYDSPSSYEAQGRILLFPTIPQLDYSQEDNLPVCPSPTIQFQSQPFDLFHSCQEDSSNWSFGWNRGGSESTETDPTNPFPIISSRWMYQHNLSDWTTLNGGNFAARAANITAPSLSSYSCDEERQTVPFNSAYTSTSLVHGALEELDHTLDASVGSGSQTPEQFGIAPRNPPDGLSRLVWPLTEEKLSQHSVESLPRSCNEGYPNRMGFMELCSYENQKRLFKEAATLPCDYPSHIVPQKMFRPPTDNEMARCIYNAQLYKPIYFWRGSACGLPLTDILMGKLDSLNSKDEIVFSGSSQSILIKLKWPGYRSWAKQVATTDFRRKNSPISLRRVAEVTAKKIQRFFQDVELQRVSKKSVDSQEESSFATTWKISPSHIRLENIILMSIHNVSQGVWQPQVRLRNRF